MLEFDLNDMLESQEVETWHHQQYEDTCAVVCQEMIIEDLTGLEYSEEELREVALEKGWYIEGSGTSLEHMAELIEYTGFEAELSDNNTIEELTEKLNNGEGIIVAVDSDEIWNQNENDIYNEFLDITTEHRVDHAVQVIGVDETDPDGPMVIINDPGHEDGMGMEIPMEVFEDAWEDGNNFMVSTDGSPATGLEENDIEMDEIISNANVGGYYNNDGTYHWSSDNTNTDEKGNVVYYG